MTTPPRNRFVLRKESGHPGYSNVVVLASQSDLQQLAEDVRRLSESGSGRVSHYVTEEKNPTSLGSVAFEVISEEQLSDLQRGDLKYRLWRLFGPVVIIAVVFLAAYGGYTLWKRLILGFAS
jgi:hypothetical protein